MQVAPNFFLSPLQGPLKLLTLHCAGFPKLSCDSLSVEVIRGFTRRLLKQMSGLPAYHDGVLLVLLLGNGAAPGTQLPLTLWGLPLQVGGVPPVLCEFALLFGNFEGGGQ